MYSFDHIPIPLEAAQPDDGQAILLVAMALGAVASLVYAVRESRRRNDNLLIYMFIGAGLSVFYEPLGDHLVHVYYPENNQYTWITNFGLEIPVFIGLLYFWYMPLAAYVMLRKRHTGFTTTVFWSEWVGKAIFFITFEIIALAICGTTWIYYGEQAFVIGDVPVLTPLTYATFALAIGLVVCLVERYVPKQYYWTLIAVVPSTMALSHMWAAFPLASTLWTSQDATVVALGSIGSAALSVFAAWGGCKLVQMKWFTENPEPNRVREDVAARA